MCAQLVPFILQHRLRHGTARDLPAVAGERQGEPVIYLGRHIMDKLEEIKKHHRDTVSFRSSTTKYEREHAWLISEVERLRGNFRGTYSFKEADYQRRHRKWALEEARTNLHDLWWVQESQTHKDKQRAEKAEAELADSKSVYAAHSSEAERQINELQMDLCNYKAWRESAVQYANKVEAELSACKERVREKLFKYGEMKKAPCFVCGYNGQNYYSPSVHPCAERHHRLQALQAQEQSKEVEG